MSLQWIWNRFPRPCVSDHRGDCEAQPYCVGGAYNLAHGVNARFPTAQLLAQTLLDTGLTADVSFARAAATACVFLNDEGAFVTARHCLDAVAENDPRFVALVLDGEGRSAPMSTDVRAWMRRTLDE